MTYLWVHTNIQNIWMRLARKNEQGILKKYVTASLFSHPLTKTRKLKSWVENMQNEKISNRVNVKTPPEIKTHLQSLWSINKCDSDINEYDFDKYAEVTVLS